MKIKEVEQRVGMKRANIRYYEKEGLLKSPERNSENNYREYSEEDIAQLQKIKVLRILGVVPEEIKLLNTGSVSMEEVIHRRTEQLEKEIKESQGILEICKTIIERDIDLQTLNEDVLSIDKRTWQDAFEDILARDIVKEVITRKQLNKTMTGMLLWGYFISMAVTAVLAFSDKVYFFENEEAIFIVPICIAVSIICEVMVYFTASVKVHTVLFHISSLIFAPMVMILTMLLSFWGRGSFNILTTLSDIQLIALWPLLMIYVVVLYLLSVKWEKMFTKMRYTLSVTAVFSVIYVLIMRMAGIQSFILAGVAVFLLFHIGLNWTTTNSDRHTYNRYYVVKEAGRIMNMFGMLFNQGGRGSSGAWLK